MHSLTPRQQEIFHALIEGWSNKEIARTLKISPATVAKHRENIYAKLKITRVGQLSLHAADLPEEFYLTPREREIVQLLHQGMTSADIARQLGLSKYSVQTHRQNIRKKRRLRNSNQSGHTVF